MIEFFEKGERAKGQNKGHRDERFIALLGSGRKMSFDPKGAIHFFGACTVHGDHGSRLLYC